MSYQAYQVDEDVFRAGRGLADLALEPEDPAALVELCGHHHRSAAAAARCGYRADRRIDPSGRRRRWGGRVCAVTQGRRRFLTASEYGAAFHVCNLGSWREGKRGPSQDIRTVTGRSAGAAPVPVGGKRRDRSHRFVVGNT